MSYIYTLEEGTCYELREEGNQRAGVQAPPEAVSWPESSPLSRRKRFVYQKLLLEFQESSAEGDGSGRAAYYLIREYKINTNIYIMLTFLDT